MTRKSPSQPPTRTVVIVVFDRCQIIDATGPAGVFGTANEVHFDLGGGAPLYDVKLVGKRTGPVRTSAGVSLLAEQALEHTMAPLDTLICAGGKGSRALAADDQAVAQVRRLAGQSRRVVSVCTGAYILAATGLLRGRRAATHWAHCRLLAEAHPEVRVEADPIFVHDGNIFTSAGVTAGMDLALALVEMDHGRDLALAVAREMVMFMKRPGSQAQFSRHLLAQMAPEGQIRDVQLWLLDNLGRDITVETMADRAAMSLRTFIRRFKEATGMTPATYVQEARIDAARGLLEDSGLRIKSVAEHCGFTDEERMRRAFQRRFGISPTDYRNRFSSPLSR